jgi:D-tyrosyl-tRNA(Tyr) deacylase
MRALVQRVARASVEVEGRTTGAIGEGMLVLLGIAPSDGEAEAAWLARKLAHLRIFRDGEGRMNRSVLEIGGRALVVSQFTLYGDCRRGHRPSFIGAAPPERAEPLYERFCALLEDVGVPVARGVFGAMMDVSLLNDGPVTILVDTPSP